VSGTLLRRGAQRVARAAGILDPETRANPMVATHNTTVEALAAMERNGGVAVAPSIGVSRAADPMTGFGDISLIAPTDLIDPRRTPVYGRDIYSPRYPSIEYGIDAANRARAARAGQSLWDQSAFGRLPGDPNSYTRDYRQNAIDALQQSMPQNDMVYNPVVREHFLRSQGVDVDALLRGARYQQDAQTIIQQAYNAHPNANDIYGYVAHLPEQHGIQYRETVNIPTNAEGETRRAAHTPQNALWAMQNEARYSHPLAGQDWRGGEQFVTDNWLLAHVAPQFRNMEELRGARSLLVGRDDPGLTQWTAGFNDLLNQAGQRVRGEGGYFESDSALRNIADAAREAGYHRIPVDAQLRHDSPEWTRLRDNLSRMNDTYYGGNIDSLLRDDIALTLDQGRRLGTTYFEAKPRRNVPLSEFVGAIVPEDQFARVVPLLDRHGIENVHSVPRPPHGGRRDANPARVDAFSRFEPHFFSAGPAAALLGGGAAAYGLLGDEEDRTQ
jgi:hypothetical protein